MRARGPAVIVIIGGRRAGKSVLAADIMLKLPNVSAGVVVEPHGFYERLVPSTWAREAYSPRLVDGLLQRQLRNKLKRKPDRALLLLDDCLHDQRAMDLHQHYMFVNNRQVNTTLIVTLRHPVSPLTANQRGNVDYVFMFAAADQAYRRSLYTLYASGTVPTFEAFGRLMDRFTGDHGCLVIRNAAPSSARLEDRVFWYRAQVHEGAHPPAGSEAKLPRAPTGRQTHWGGIVGPGVDDLEHSGGGVGPGVHDLD
jgi:hypothetical protein